MALRLATLDDVPALHALIARSVRGLMGGDYAADVLEGALEGWLGLDTQLIRDQTYFVIEGAAAEQGGSAVLAAGGWSARRTPFGGDAAGARDVTLLDPRTEAARIRAFYVDPAAARRGLGTLLLEACETAARAAGFRRAQMGATLTGVPLYRRCGYVETGRGQLPLARGGGLEIVLMEKPLT